MGPCSQPTIISDREVYKINKVAEPMMREELFHQPMMMKEEQFNQIVLHQVLSQQKNVPRDEGSEDPEGLKEGDATQ